MKTASRLLGSSALAIAFAAAAASPALAVHVVPKVSGLAATAPRAVVVHPRRADLVVGGHVVRSVTLAGGPEELSLLSISIGDSRYLATPNAHTVAINALIQLSPGVTLRARAPFTTAVTMSPGTAIEGSKSNVVLSGVTVTATGPAAQRASISIAHGSLTVTNAVLKGLGRTARGLTGLEVGTASTAVLKHVTSVDGVSGFQALGSGAVSIQDLSVQNPSQDAVVISKAVGPVILAGLNVDGATGSGLVVRGLQGKATLSDLIVSGSTGWGADLDASNGITLTSLIAKQDALGGLHLKDVAGTTVKSVTVDGGAVGAQVRGRSSGDSLSSLIVQQVTGTGVSLGGTSNSLADATINGGGTAVEVVLGATKTALHSLSISGARSGLKIDKGSVGTSVNGIAVQNATRRAIGLYGSASTITNATVSGSPIGIDVTDPHARVATAKISSVATAITADAGSGLALTGLDVHATKVGVHAAKGAKVSVGSSRLAAPRALQGHITLLKSVSLPQRVFPWLGAAGAVALLAALVLEGLRSLRGRRDQAAPVPDCVVAAR